MFDSLTGSNLPNQITWIKNQQNNNATPNAKHKTPHENHQSINIPYTQLQVTNQSDFKRRLFYHSN
jgi:hypothetical protein